MLTKTVQVGGLDVLCFESDLIGEMTYLVDLGSDVLIVDPHCGEPGLLDYKGRNVLVFLTHEHLDHISGVNFLKENLDCRIVTGKECGAIISSPKNKTSLFPLLFLNDKEKYEQVRSRFSLPYICQADTVFDVDTVIECGDHRLELFATPGHTKASVSLFLDGRIFFGGDTLLDNGEVLRSVDSDRKLYFDFTLPLLHKKLSSDVIVFPGHGCSQSPEYYWERNRI